MVKKRMNKRSFVILSLLTFGFAVLVVRVFWVQVVQGGTYLTLAENTWAKESVIPASRGMIYDRNRQALAMNVPAYNVSLNPQVIQKLKITDEVTDALSSLLGVDDGYVSDLIGKKRSNGQYYGQVELRQGGWQLDQKTNDKLVRLKLDLQKKYGVSDVGIMIAQVDKRIYPDDSLAAQVLGYVDRDGKPIMGLEKSLNGDLQQTDGKIVVYKDGNAIALPNGTITYQKPVNGENVTLTIDEQIQFYAEEALKDLKTKYNPKSATVIVADPNTLDILAMANSPGFNPNAFWQTNDFGAFYNHATQSVYEPGSTFKIVTLAAAVQEGLFDPNERYKSGQIQVPGRVIHDIVPEGWGTISFLEGLKRSSNVEFVKLGYEKLKPAKLEQYIRDFGFGAQTGLEVSGESKGVINMKYPADFAAASYGQGQVQVTPVQQIAAISAIANGGKLMQPHLIKSIEDPQQNSVQTTAPKVIRQVISPETAHKVGGYLEQVVSDRLIGSGRYAYLDGYTVAGKTGTANKVENGQYAEGKHVVSFIGYAPVSAPKLAILVIVDEPNSEVAGGGVVAAPVFQQIMLNSLRYLKVPEDRVEPAVEQQNRQLLTTPDFVGKGINDMDKSDWNVTTVGAGDKVVSQSPASGMKINAFSPIYLFTAPAENQAPPDLTGVSLIDAINISRILKFKLDIHGAGFVVKQTYDKPSNALTVELQPEIKTSD